MSEYRRFVSYIYEYTNGKKSKNTGFAKVESRNGVCRMQIHLQKIPREEKALNIYGFVRESGWLLGILLGKICVQGTVGEARIQTPAGDIGGSGYALSQLSGMWVESGQGRTYLTVFDDEGIDTAKLVKELPEPEKTEEEKEAGEVKSRAAEAEETESCAAEAEETESHTGEAEETESRTGEAEETESHTGEAEETESRAAAEKEEGDPTEERGKEEWTGEKEPEASEVHKEEEENGSEQLHAQETAACPAPGCPYRNRQAHPAGLDQKWKMLSGRCPHFKPFAEDELDDCIQITPRELHVIRQGNCRMGNNSFLMHGFCNYRHLLFGRLRDGGYLLGIPGVFENQELFMANMFGFPEFREAVSRHPQGGRFGYWCRRL